MDLTSALMVTILGYVALFKKRAKQQEIQERGWDDEPVPEPPGVVHTDLDPCHLSDRTGDRRGVPLEGGGELCPVPADVEPRDTGVPFAEGEPQFWPVRPKRGKQQLKVSYWDVRDKIHGRWGREFLAKRKNRETGAERFHVGVDLPGARFDDVIAIEDGTVIAFIPNFLPPTWAILVQNDSGAVVNYGEVEPRSFLKHGLGVGSRVTAGQKIAQIGAHEMLHIETYTKGTTDNVKWHPGETQPPALLDPSRYLVIASIVEKNKVA